MKAENFIKYFTRAILILIPVSYFVIAAAEGNAYWIAGVMLVLTLFAYAINFTGGKK